MDLWNTVVFNFVSIFHNYLLMQMNNLTSKIDAI